MSEKHIGWDEAEPGTSDSTVFFGTIDEAIAIGIARAMFGEADPLTCRLMDAARDPVRPLTPET